MPAVLNENDLAPMASDGVTPRWSNRAQRARNDLREQGLLRDDTPPAIWEITDQARQWLR